MKILLHNLLFMSEQYNYKNQWMDLKTYIQKRYESGELTWEQAYPGQEKPVEQVQVPQTLQEQQEPVPFEEGGEENTEKTEEHIQQHVEPKIQSNIEAGEEIEQLRSQYKEKTGNDVPNRFKNDSEWIKSKLS